MMNKQIGLSPVLGALLLLAMIVTQPVYAGVLYAVQESGDRLVTFDTDSLVKTDIGPLGVLYNFGGLAYDPNSNVLYMIDGRSTNSLYTVNQSTGQATAVGPHGVTDLFGLGYDSLNDVLFAGSRLDRNLYTINVNTGQASFVGNSGITIDGLAYDSKNDRLVNLTGGGGDLYELDRTNATATLLSNGPFVNNTGLAYDPDKDLFWAIDFSGNLFSFDPNNGFARTLQASNLGPHDGLTYLSSPVPEPTTLLLLGLGLAGLGFARKRLH